MHRLMGIRKSLPSQFCSKRKPLGIYMHLQKKFWLFIWTTPSLSNVNLLIFYMKFQSCFSERKIPSGKEISLCLQLLFKNLWTRETAIATTRIVKKKCIQGLYLYVLLKFILGFWTLSAIFTGKIWCFHKKGLPVNPLSIRKGKR